MIKWRPRAVCAVFNSSSLPEQTEQEIVKQIPVEDGGDDAR